MRSINILINRFILILFTIFFIVGTLQAATFSVNSTADTSDANIGDGACADGGGNCTLRAAIEEANFTMATDTINFSIAPFDGSVKTFTPSSPLPDITQPVFINGYTQSGASVNTLTTSDNAVILIELDGTTAGAGNLVSGNTGDGMNFGNTSNLIVQGNLIGTKADGITALSNGGDGIDINAGGSGNQIGGTGANEGNKIAFNMEDGVQVDDVGFAPVGHPILGNSIFSNGGLGINLSIDGVTPNDAGDADTGANRLQNFPVITTAMPGSTRIIGTFNSTASQTFRLEFFNSPTVDASGNGEGQIFIGAVNVTTDASGNAAFDQTFAPNSPLNSYISATATDLTTNDTSEFSGSKQILNTTAASVSIGGRVMNTFGRGIFGANVALTDSYGNQRTARTNGFGYYRFADVAAGETYVLTVTSKWGEFFPQVLFVNDNRDDINFIANQKSLNGF